MEYSAGLLNICESLAQLLYSTTKYVWQNVHALDTRLYLCANTTIAVADSNEAHGTTYATIINWSTEEN